MSLPRFLATFAFCCEKITNHGSSDYGDSFRQARVMFSGSPLPDVPTADPVPDDYFSVAGVAAVALKNPMNSLLVGIVPAATAAANCS